MKWFKHYTDMHDGRSINDLMDKLGHTGLCFFLLQELCAEKLDQKSSEGVTNIDCLFGFHARTVRQKLRVSPATLQRLLDVCAANGLLSFKFSGSSLEISMPILLDLLDKHTKNGTKTRRKAAQKGPLEVEVDKEVEVEVDVSAVEKVKVFENKRQDPMAYMRPQNQAFMEVLKVLELESSFRTQMDNISGRFQNAEELQEWVDGLVGAKTYQSLENKAAQKRYISGSLKKEISQLVSV